MCSTLEARLAKISAAIDEVALAARAAARGHGEPEDLAGRLAGLWAMIAELDPALATRLRGYCPDPGLRLPPRIGPAPPLWRAGWRQARRLSFG